MSTSILIKTYDGGLTWEDTLYKNLIGSMWIIDSNNIAVNNDRIFNTNDGGKNWFSGMEYGSEISNFCFIDSLKGYVADFGDKAKGITGNLLVTKDGGYTWQKDTSLAKGHFYNVFFVDSK